MQSVGVLKPSRLSIMAAEDLALVVCSMLQRLNTDAHVCERCEGPLTEVLKSISLAHANIIKRRGGERGVAQRLPISSVQGPPYVVSMPTSVLLRIQGLLENGELNRWEDARLRVSSLEGEAREILEQLGSSAAMTCLFNILCMLQNATSLLEHDRFVLGECIHAAHVIFTLESTRTSAPSLVGTYCCPLLRKLVMTLHHEMESGDAWSANGELCTGECDGYDILSLFGEDAGAVTEAYDQLEETLNIAAKIAHTTDPTVVEDYRELLETLKVSKRSWMQKPVRPKRPSMSREQLRAPVVIENTDSALVEDFEEYYYGPPSPGVNGCGCGSMLCEHTLPKDVGTLKTDSEMSRLLSGVGSSSPPVATHEHSQAPYDRIEEESSTRVGQQSRKRGREGLGNDDMRVDRNSAVVKSKSADRVPLAGNTSGDSAMSVKRRDVDIHCSSAGASSPPLPQPSSTASSYAPPNQQQRILPADPRLVRSKDPRLNRISPPPLSVVNSNIQPPLHTHTHVPGCTHAGPWFPVGNSISPPPSGGTQVPVSMHKNTRGASPPIQHNTSRLPVGNSSFQPPLPSDTPMSMQASRQGSSPSPLPEQSRYPGHTQGPMRSHPSSSHAYSSVDSHKSSAVESTETLSAFSHGHGYVSDSESSGDSISRQIPPPPPPLPVETAPLKSCLMLTKRPKTSETERKCRLKSTVTVTAFSPTEDKVEQLKTKLENIDVVNLRDNVAGRKEHHEFRYRKRTTEGCSICGTSRTFVQKICMCGVCVLCFRQGKISGECDGPILGVWSPTHYSSTDTDSTSSEEDDLAFKDANVDEIASLRNVHQPSQYMNAEGTDYDRKNYLVKRLDYEMHRVCHPVPGYDPFRIIRVVLGITKLYNYKRLSKESILHAAVYAGRIDVVQELLSVGADTSLRDFYGSTPYDLAVARKQHRIAALLAPTST